jgi:polyisoprenoid-binding protein YceI
MTSATPTATAAAPAASTIWNIDAAHSVAEFKVQHMMISYVKGKFSGRGLLLANDGMVLR